MTPDVWDEDQIQGLCKAFEKKLGYYPNIQNPRTYPEKLTWKRIYDRNPLLTVTQDKYASYEYVRGKGLGHTLIPLLHVSRSPGDMPFDTLPDRYVIKANHGCGWYFLVLGNEMRTVHNKVHAFDKNYIQRACAGWLSKTYSGGSEWAYKYIDPCIMIQEMLWEPGSGLAQDYKCVCFNGKCQYIDVIQDRISGARIRKCSYDREWNNFPIETEWEAGDAVEKPECLNELLLFVDKLSEDFPSVRVDMYVVNNKIYFGEFTHYPSGGRPKIKPDEMNLVIGKDWQVEHNYWRKHEQQ
jgi:hypothetical protein